jgi:hypothetical protein
VRRKKPFWETNCPWKLWVAKRNYMEEIFETRKKCPVSANVKITVFIR